MGWLMAEQWQDTETDRVKDLAKYPELVFLDRHYLIPPVLYAVAIFFAFGFHGLVWGFFVSTIFLFHGTFTVNSLNHVIGHRNYQTTDTHQPLVWHSSPWAKAGTTTIILPTVYRPRLALVRRDASYYILKMASWVGITKGVSKPPVHVMQRTQKRVTQKADGVLQDLLESAGRTRELMRAKMAEYELEFARKKEATHEAWSDKVETMQAEMDALTKSRKY